MGDNFDPEVGFIQRDDFRRAFASLRFSPRPRDFLGVRKFTWQADLEHLENGGGALETRVHVGKFTTEFNSSDSINVEATRDYEMIAQPFQVAGGGRIAPAATRSTMSRSATPSAHSGAWPARSGPRWANSGTAPSAA